MVKVIVGVALLSVLYCSLVHSLRTEQQTALEVERKWWKKGLWVVKNETLPNEHTFMSNTSTETEVSYICKVIVPEDDGGEAITGTLRRQGTGWECNYFFRTDQGTDGKKDDGRIRRCPMEKKACEGNTYKLLQKDKNPANKYEWQKKDGIEDGTVIGGMTIFFSPLFVCRGVVNNITYTGTYDVRDAKCHLPFDGPDGIINALDPAGVELLVDPRYQPKSRTR